MINFDFVENCDHPFDDEISKYNRQIFDIGRKIKKELGLRKNPFTITDETFRVDSIAGSISLGNIHINIWPKIFRVNGIEERNNEVLKKLYRRVFETCGKSLNKTIYISKYKSINELDCDFIHAISEEFAEELENAIKHIKITSYKTKIEKKQSIRGKILVQKELKNPILEPKTWCRYKELSEDNNSNRLLLWCCKYLMVIVSDFKLRNRLSRLIQQFSNVNVKSLDLNFVNRLIVPRQYNIYSKCLHIARNLFLNNYNHKEVNSQEGNMFGYIINMEKAFENIVGFYVESGARKLGLEYRGQYEKQLADSSTGGKYSVRPDDVVISSKGTLIIDAKYKLQIISENINKPKPSREDFYQMIATCIAYNTYNAILIYPEIPNSSGCEHSWEVENSTNDKKITIMSRQIDIISQKDTLESRLVEILFESKCI